MTREVTCGAGCGMLPLVRRGCVQAVCAEITCAPASTKAVAKLQVNVRFIRSSPVNGVHCIPSKEGSSRSGTSGTINPGSARRVVVFLDVQRNHFVGDSLLPAGHVMAYR